MCSWGAESKQLNTFSLRCQFLARERQNIHDDLYQIDPSIISYDEESLLNALPYGSDEFNDKINREILLRITYYIRSNINMCSTSPKAYISLRCVLGDVLSFVLLLVIS